MANTFEINLSVAYKDSASAIRFQVPSKRSQTSIASNIYAGGTQNIGFASEEALDIGTVAANGGSVYLYNRDATNYVEIGLVISATFQPFITLAPGEFAVTPGISNRALYAKANTAAIDLEYFITEP
jgi:hypothetical protein